MKNLATKAYDAALAPAAQQTPVEALAEPGPAPAAPNYGLTQAYSNLVNKLKAANKNGLSNLVTKARTAINAAKNNQGPEMIKLRANVNAQVKKANALNKATGGLEQALKSFLKLTANAAKKNGSASLNQLNSAYVQLPQNVQNAFRPNYNKAKANLTNVTNAVAKAPTPPRSITVSGTKYFVSNTNKALKNANVKTVYALQNNGSYIGGTRARSGFGPFAKNTVTLGANKFNWNGQNFKAH